MTKLGSSEVFDDYDEFPQRQKADNEADNTVKTNFDEIRALLKKN